MRVVVSPVTNHQSPLIRLRMVVGMILDQPQPSNTSTRVRVQYEPLLTGCCIFSTGICAALSRLRSCRTAFPLLRSSLRSCLRNPYRTCPASQPGESGPNPSPQPLDPTKSGKQNFRHARMLSLLFVCISYCTRKVVSFTILTVADPIVTLTSSTRSTNSLLSISRSSASSTKSPSALTAPEYLLGGWQFCQGAHDTPYIT